MSDDLGTVQDLAERTTLIHEPTGLSLVAGTLGGIGSADDTGAAARFNYPYAIAADGAGNLYVADTYNHTIRKVVAATGAVTTLAGSSGLSGSTDGIGAAARFNSPQGVGVDGAGNLYVADSENQTIRKVVVATGDVTTVAGSVGVTGSADGIGPAARFGAPHGVAADAAGNLYVADTANCTIRKVVVATGDVTTLAGTANVAGTADGNGAAARFSRPYGVVLDGAGSLYVADEHSRTIRKVVVATANVTTLAGAPLMAGSTDGTGAAARFHDPYAIAADGAGNLYVADMFNHTIRKVVAATGEVTTLVGTAGLYGSSDGTGAAARFLYPRGVAADSTGNVYVTDSDNHTLRKVVVATSAVTTLAGTVRSYGSTDGTGAAARFSNSYGVVANGVGHLYVADTFNHTIRKVVAATGEVTTLAGTAGLYGSADGTGAAARFETPRGLALDGAGDLFVADTGNQIIRKVVVATGVVTTLTRFNQRTGSRDIIRFSGPEAVAVDRAGHLYVADTHDHQIWQIVTATGDLSTLVGAVGMRGSSDGSGFDARFDSPNGLVVDRTGKNLYVADSGNHTIRRVTLPSRVVTTLAGAAGLSGSTDDFGAAARFRLPHGLALDGAGDLIISDYLNGTIRKLQLSSSRVTTLIGVAGQRRVTLGPLPVLLNGAGGLAVSDLGVIFLLSENAVLRAY